MLMTDGVEQVEYTSPRSFLEERGARVTLLSPKPVGEAIQAFNHNAPGDTFKVEMNVRDARPGDFDALVLPGGAANADQLRLSQEAVSFIREYGEEDKPLAAICHGPRILIDAGMAQSRHMTSWPSLQTELRDAGAEWTDDQVVVDDKLITSRNPGDIPAFNDALMNELMVGAGTDPGPTS
jgi:protease I